MQCPNCQTKMDPEPCTYKRDSGCLGDAVIYTCPECEYQCHVAYGKVRVLFEGNPSVDRQIIDCGW